MVFVFLRKDDFFGRYLPVNLQSRVVPGNGSFTLGGIEIVALVLEDDFIAQYAESVGKASWNEELAVIVFGQFHSYMLSESGRTLSDVHRHVEYRTLDDSYQLALSKRWFLKMQSA